MPPCAPQRERAAAGPCSPLLSAVKRIFWAGGTSGESKVHPLGLATVPVMAPSGSISRLEWWLHSSLMDGSRPARSLELRGEDGCCGVEAKDGAALSGDPR